MTPSLSPSLSDLIYFNKDLDMSFNYISNYCLTIHVSNHLSLKPIGEKYWIGKPLTSHSIACPAINQKPSVNKMQLAQRLQIFKKSSHEKEKQHKVKWGNNFHSRKKCKKSNPLPPSVHQFLSSSAILINMLINTLRDLIASDNCKVHAEIKSKAANVLLVKNIIIAQSTITCFFLSFSLKGKVAIWKKI